MKRKAFSKKTETSKDFNGVEVEQATDTLGQCEKIAAKKAKLPKKKYILFVGNLAYDTNKEDLETFFADCRTASIRLLTDKATKKSKGFAFVEFSDSSSLEAALGKHNQKIKGRKVNIAFTVGGGGASSDYRKKKIKEKNERLKEERSKSSALNRE